MSIEDRRFPLLPIRKTLAYKSEFRSWLAAQGFSTRAQNDIISRTMRAAEIADILATGTDAEVLFQLSQQREFEKATVNVKSHLKRSVTLYRAFCRTRKSS